MRKGTVGDVREDREQSLGAMNNRVNYHVLGPSPEQFSHGQQSSKIAIT